MKILTSAALAAGLIALAGCNSTPAENAAENIEQAADNQADMLDAQADNATNETTESTLENQADAVRAEGDAKAEAVEEGAAPADTNGM